MTPPTDDELEAMAVTMADYCLHDVAAMLRACKGRVGVDTHTVASEAFKAIVWGSQQPPPPHGAAYPSYTRYGNSDAETEARATAARILSALDPAPDHAEWNADNVYKSVGEVLASMGHGDVSPKAREKIKRALDSALKKGPAND